MGKKFQLPKKILAAKESESDATMNPTAADSGENQNLMPASFPLDATNLREDFKRQAAELREKIKLGPTPAAKTKPKVSFSLDSKGNLKGEIDSIEEGKDSTSIDLTKQASAVNEGVKRPIFKRKSRTSQETVVSTSSPKKGGISDERESKDKQPKEAVAVESRFPAFNRREQDLLSAGNPDAVKRAMANGTLSRIRGRQILYSMGAAAEALSVPAFETKEVPTFAAIIDWLSDYKTAFVDCIDHFNIEADKEGRYTEARFTAARVTRKQVLDWIADRKQLAKAYASYFKAPAKESYGAHFTKPTDAGAPLDPPEVSTLKPRHKNIIERAREASLPKKSTIESLMDNYVKERFPKCQISYRSKSPAEGTIRGVSNEAVSDIRRTLENAGLKVSVSKSAREELSIAFVEEQPVQTNKWYALILQSQAPTRVSQVTLTTNEGATESEVRNYLEQAYGADKVLQVSTKPIS